MSEDIMVTVTDNEIEHLDQQAPNVTCDATATADADDMASYKCKRQTLDKKESSWYIPANTTTNHHPLSSFTNRVQSSVQATLTLLEANCRQQCERIENEVHEEVLESHRRWVEERKALYEAQLEQQAQRCRREYCQALAVEKARFAQEKCALMKHLCETRDEVSRLRGLESQWQREGRIQQESMALQDGRRITKIRAEEHVKVLKNENRVLKIQVEECKRRAEDAHAALSRHKAHQAKEAAMQESEICQLHARDISNSAIVNVLKQRERELEETVAAVHAEKQAMQHDRGLLCLKIGRLEDGMQETEGRLMQQLSAACESRDAAERRASLLADACGTATAKSDQLAVKVEHLLRENGALTRGMETSEEAVRQARAAEQWAKEQQKHLVCELESIKTDCSTLTSSHRALDRELSQCNERIRSLTTSLSTAIANQENALQQTEETRLLLGIAIREAEAVCNGARALGTAGPSCAAPLVAVVQETEASLQQLKKKVRQRGLHATFPYASSFIRIST